MFHSPVYFSSDHFRLSDSGCEGNLTCWCDWLNSDWSDLCCLSCVLLCYLQPMRARPLYHWWEQGVVRSYCEEHVVLEYLAIPISQLSKVDFLEHL